MVVRDFLYPYSLHLSAIAESIYYSEQIDICCSSIQCFRLHRLKPSVNCSQGPQFLHKQRESWILPQQHLTPFQPRKQRTLGTVPPQIKTLLLASPSRPRISNRKIRNGPPRRHQPTIPAKPKHLECLYD